MDWARITRFGLLPALLAATAACDVDRPPDRACPLLPLGAEPPAVVTTVSSQSPNTATVNAMIQAIEAPEGGSVRARPAPRPVNATPNAATVERVENVMRAEAEAQQTRRTTQPARRAPRPEPIIVRIISLSAGGQWGAFGAGLMAGWSQNPTNPRPNFDVVTGVSAGAIIAVPVFAGSDFDSVLSFYRGIEADDVSRRRAIPALIRAPSLADPAPVEAFFRRSVTPEMVRAIAARHAQGDQLLVSATNLDTTEGEVFDLGSVARMQDSAQAADCIVEAMLASSAIPGLLPPRHINGALYADGGLRDQVFFRAVDTARVRVARDLGRPVLVEAYVVVNGPLEPPTTPARDRLLGYIGRSVEALADEVQRDSIVDAVSFASGREGWTLRGMIPNVDLSACGFESTPTSTFDACLTREVFDAGFRAGQTSPIQWMDAEQLRRIAQEL